MKFFNWLFRRSEPPSVPAVPLFCECDDVDCLAFLPIEKNVFLDTRVRHPRASIVLLGHENAKDTVLERHDFYLVVR